MPLLHKLLNNSLLGKVLLGLLASAYLVYLVAFAGSFYTSIFAPTQGIVEHQVDTSSSAAVSFWTVANMRTAINDDVQTSSTADYSQVNIDTSKGTAAQQQGQAPSNSNVDYPHSTVGKIFFRSGGLDYVCSGTAVVSNNQNTVDTAGHCIYSSGNWVQNLIFCPLYNNGSTPYGCWAARDLVAPSEWINAKPNDYHQDFGMVIVSSNSEGTLTDVVGGVGWAYNQSTNLSFSAYGYPAGSPFDGQTRVSCENAVGTSWQHGSGTVVSIPCNMTGGSSGGPWFIQIGSNWYLNGHNDFTSSLQRNHMFSPYYDDVWYTLYSKAQNS